MTTNTELTPSQIDAVMSDSLRRLENCTLAERRALMAVVKAVRVWRAEDTYAGKSHANDDIRYAMSLVPR